MPITNDMPQGKDVLPEQPVDGFPDESVPPEKDWYMSKGVWGSLVAGAAGFSGLFGLNIDADTVNGITNVIMSGVVTISAAWSLYGRVVANSTIRF